MQFCLFINDIKGLFLWTIRNQTIRNNLFASRLWFDGSSYELKMQSWARLWWLLLSFTGDLDHHFYFLIWTFTRWKCIFLHTADHFETAELINLAHSFKKAQHHWSVRARTCPQPRTIMMKAKCLLGLSSSGVPLPWQTNWTFPEPTENWRSFGLSVRDDNKVSQAIC